MGDALLSGAWSERGAQHSGVLLAGVWIGGLVDLVHPMRPLATVVAVALAVFLGLAALRASAHIRVLFGFVVGLAAVLAWWHDLPATLVDGFRRSQIFGAFLPSVLFLRATAESSPRLARLRRGMGALDRAGAQNWTLYGSHVLGAVLNVGAMSVLAPVVAQGADDIRRRALAASSARGVGTAVMWSPFFVAMGFTSQLVPQVPIWQIMAVGSGLAVVCLVVSHVIFTPTLGAHAFAQSLARLRPIAAPMAVVIVAVVGANALLGWSGLQSVSLMVPLCCVLYIAILGATSARQVARRTLASFGRLADELLIVTGATMLATVVAALPEAHAMGAGLDPGFTSGVALLAALVVVLVVLGLAGLHPMIGAGIVLPVIAAGSFGICPAVLVAAAVFAWGLSASISPWTLPIVAASLNFQVPVRELLSRQTLTFGLACAAGGIAYLGLVNALCNG